MAEGSSQTNEVHAASQLQLAWARASIFTMLVGVCWVVASLRFDLGAPQIAYASGLLLIGGIVARFVLVKPPMTTLRITPSRIEIGDANGVVRSVDRREVESAYVRGRSAFGFVIPRTVGIGHAQLMFGTDNGRLCLGHSVSWMRTAQIAALIENAGINWKGATNYLCDPAGLPPAIWPPTIPKQSTDSSIIPPATIAVAKRIHIQTLISVLVSFGGLALAFTLDNYRPVNHFSMFFVSYGIAYAGLHFTLNTLITSLSRRTVVASLAYQRWWPCEVITYAPPKERFAHGVHLSGRLVQFIEPETGHLSAPYLIAPGHDADWLEPTQRLWAYCTGSINGDKMLIAPPDRSSIAYASLVYR